MDKNQDDVLLEMRDIVKRYPGVLANDEVNLSVRKGEIHGLVGENGAGKSTLMKILYGLYKSDGGEIFYQGERINLDSPKDAIDLGIGMVHQHFMLIPRLSVVKNIVLGLKESKNFFLDLESAKKKIVEFSVKYGLEVDPDAKVWQLSVGEKQRVEIIKALYRGIDLLILDEPTAVLTPNETENLFDSLKEMSSEGLTIIFITHKLNEALDITDTVTVLRDGKDVGELKTGRTTQSELAEKMVGREVLFESEKSEVELGETVFEIKDLYVSNDKGIEAVKGVDLDIRAGEIYGIAGVSGNGQTELTEVISGLRKASNGKIKVDGENITNNSPKDVIKSGVAFIPEDRMKYGLALELPISDNLIVKSFDSSKLSTNLNMKYDKIKEKSDELIRDFNIKASSSNVKLDKLSGGNMQKVILARELNLEPKVLIASQPTRGLDVGAIEYVREVLLEQKEKGLGILLLSDKLDEVIDLSDRIGVMYEGEILEEVNPDEVEKSEIGVLMTGGRD